MGKVNKETDRKNRLKYLILIVAFIAIMLVVSTYAWFSTQRSVTIANLTGNVQVAEGLEISLNGQTWSNELDLSALDIKTNSYDQNTNIKPNELLPVSTEGNVSADPDGKTIVMYKGEASAEELAKVTKCNEAQTTQSELDYPAYIAFDVFIRDSSASDSAQNSLYLTPTSTVKVKSSGGYEEYGLQNTVRVGFAKFSGTCTYAESSSQSNVISKTVQASDSKINQIAIWEPNANYHIDYIVSNNNKINVTDKSALNLNESGLFEKSTVVPTFALADGIDTTINGTSDKKIGNVYDWDQSYFKKQNTVKTGIDISAVLANDTPSRTQEIYPSNYGIINQTNCAAVDSELGVKLTDTSAETGTDVQVKGNTVTRFRIYVWLEGQDVDCINYASHGGGIEVNMGLQKPASATATPSASPSV